VPAPHRGQQAGAAAARCVLLALVCAAIGGCAIGNTGTLTAHLERGDTLSVLTVYSLGLHLRTRVDDPGAHLGYSRRSYTFAGSVQAAPGWYFLRLPALDDDAIAQELMTVGIDVTPATPDASITLGYLHTRLLARVAVDADVLIEYAGSRQRIERVIFCTKDTACDIHSR